MTVELLWRVSRSVELWVFVLLAARDHQHCISVGLEYGQLLHSEKSFGRREIALCPSYHLLCWNLKVCIYFPVSTELWEPVLFEKPSRSKLSSPHRDTGMTQAVRDSFPFVGNLWPENLPIFHKTVWELGGEKGPVRMLLFPERGCRSVACWVIPTALYRAFLAFLLNMMFLEWERKEVFFFSSTDSPTPNLRCSLSSSNSIALSRSETVFSFQASQHFHLSLCDYVSIKAFAGLGSPSRLSRCHLTRKTEAFWLTIPKMDF